MRDHEIVILEEFGGLWARGDLDSCPADHCTEILNYKFLESGFKQRDGIEIVKASSSAIIKWYYYPDAGAGDGFLVLKADQRIYHIWGTLPSSWTEFAVSSTITGMTDFGFVSINGRAYISPTVNDNLSGLPGEFVYVYAGNGTDVMRKAGGTAPTDAEGTMTAAASATAGNVENGRHIYGVVYETNSGFQTQIGPDTLPTLVSDGTKKVDLASIPIFGGGGGTLITKRHIVASKVLPDDYNGDTRGYELFFVPGGEITNNTATTLTINFYDAELVDSAANLLDLLSEIPAGGGLGTYHNRLLVWDTATQINIVYVSYPDEPEAFDAVDGFLLVPKDGIGITYAQEYRDILYVGKNIRLYAFNDNGDAPTSWPMVTVDQGLGVGKRGVASVTASGGVNSEALLLLNEQGLYLFTGVLNKPELTYKIKDLWAIQSKTQIRTGKIAIYIDPIGQLIYINLPAENMMLVGDYSDGMSAEKIKWTKWPLGLSPTTIGLFDKDNKLFIGSATGTHYIKIDKTDDTISPSAAVKIPDPTYITALVNDSDGRTPDNDEDIYHFGGIRLRVVGSGNLIPRLIGMDSVLTQTLSSITMTTAPGREVVVLGNLVTQRARLEIKTSVINQVSKVNRIVMYVKAMYTAYPA